MVVSYHALLTFKVLHSIAPHLYKQLVPARIMFPNEAMLTWAR